MSSRQKILENVRGAQPAALPLPELTTFDLGALSENSLPRLISTLDSIGAQVIRLGSRADISTWLRENLPESAEVASTVPEVFAGTVVLHSEADPHTLKNVHTAILEADFGVCENGALWLQQQSEPLLPCSLPFHRVLPFIAEHVILLLKASETVPDLHAAYRRLSTQKERSFGLFIAGPSKTADIEQCLVIGAHGARSLTVILYGP